MGSSKDYLNNEFDRMQAVKDWKQILQEATAPVFLVSDPDEKMCFTLAGATSIPVVPEDVNLFIKTITGTRRKFPFIIAMKQDDQETVEKLKAGFKKSRVKFVAELDPFNGQGSAEAASGSSQETFKKDVQNAITVVKAVQEQEEADQTGTEVPYLEKWGAIDTSDPPDPVMFHRLNKDGAFKGVYDARIFEYITEKFPMFFLGGVPYIYQSGVYVLDEKGTRLKSMIWDLILDEFRNGDVINRVYKLFTINFDLERTINDLNAYPDTWINFQNGFFDVREWKMIPHDPKYLSINQIPHVFDPEAMPSGEKMEEWLHFIVPVNGDREMLLQFIGYCMTKDTSRQAMLFTIGVAGAGKSTLINLIGKIIGESNSVNVSLNDLDEGRFTTVELVGKLVNCCADIEVGALKNLSVFKQLTGQDRMKAERKFKDPFYFRNQARLIFSSNQNPEVPSEKSDAFYRRLLILKFDKAPETPDPDLEDKLQKEIDHLIWIAVKAAFRMYKQGYITESSNSKAAKAEIKVISDNVESWLVSETVPDPEGRVNRADCYENYKAYCERSRLKASGAPKFYQALKDKGYESKKSNLNYILGLKLGKPDPESFPNGKEEGEEFEPVDEQIELLFG